MARPCQAVQRGIGAFGELPLGGQMAGHLPRYACLKGLAIPAQPRLASNRPATRWKCRQEWNSTL